MNKKFQVVGIGEVLWDIYPDARYLGGAVSNSIYHINKLNHKGIIISKVGNDKLGEEIISELKKKGVHTEYIQIDTNKMTGFVSVTLNKDKVPSFKCASDTAYEFIDWDRKFENLVHSTDALLFGTLVQINPHSRKTLYKIIETLKNTLIVYDINLRGWPGESNELIERSLYYSDVLKLNIDEFLKLKENFNINLKDDVACLKVILETYHLKLIALSLGAQGSLLLDKEQVIYAPGVCVKPIDTTGAGDAYVASIIIKYLEGAPLKETGMFSNYLGAFITTKKGATPEYNPGTIDSFINKSKKYNYEPEYKKFAVDPFRITPSR